MVINQIIQSSSRRPQGSRQASAAIQRAGNRLSVPQSKANHCLAANPCGKME
jgi:hypothetical protein